MDCKEILKKYWGYSAFRPLQEEIIDSVLNGKDTLALLPTGGGKSICFQVPAMAKEGMCLVISPLIALMKDQVQNLKKRGIEASALYAGMRMTETDLVNNHCENNKIKFLYVSPERLENQSFINRMKQWNINLIAIDEAHCISQWGYDFRPPYLKIVLIRQYFPGVPVLALTATAVPHVVEDIQRRLEFRSLNVFQKSFHRDNLAYIVIHEEDKKGRLLRIVNKTKGSGIVYVRNRRKTAEVARQLQKDGISADFYHAGLEASVRSKRQDEWMSGKTRVMVATNAFGMGIDKPDVRFVVHLDIPETLEAYFQEAGRAGRDENESYSVILYDQQDIEHLKTHYDLGWPAPQKIREIYLALSNYARIPMGSGNGASIGFNLAEFSKQYKFNPVTAFKVLKFLENEGYILMQEDLDMSSRLHICCSREELYQVQISYPLLDPLIKTLLRSYGGLFTDYVPVNETDLARRCDCEPGIFTKQLIQLENLKVIDYIPKPSETQLVFCRDRIDEKYLAINQTNYLRQKEIAMERLKAVLHYISLSNHCRSLLLLNYFGEKSNIACGKCDVCLKSAREKVNEKDFRDIAGMIVKVLSEGPLFMEDLRMLVKSHPESRVIKVINYMIEHDQIEVDRKKRLTLKI